MANDDELFSTNAQVFGEAEHVQSKTKDALVRIQRQAAETEEIGNDTLDELRSQRQQLNNIQREGDQLNYQLGKTNKLQNRFDRWAGHWRGTNKREAKAEAALVAAATKLDRKRREMMNSGKENICKNDDRLGESSSNRTDGSQPKKWAGTRVVTRPKKSDILAASQDNPEEIAKLDDESKAGLERLSKNDKDIDTMLDSTMESLDRLTALSESMKEETQAHTKQIEETEQIFDKAHGKQVLVNARVKRVLTGRWLKRTEQESVAGK